MPSLAVHVWPHADRLGDRRLPGIGAGGPTGADQPPLAAFSVVVTRTQLRACCGFRPSWCGCPRAAAACIEDALRGSPAPRLSGVLGCGPASRADPVADRAPSSGYGWSVPSRSAARRVLRVAAQSAWPVCSPVRARPKTAGSVWRRPFPEHRFHSRLGFESYPLPALGGMRRGGWNHFHLVPARTPAVSSSPARSCARRPSPVVALLGTAVERRFECMRPHELQKSSLVYNGAVARQASPP